jgi:glycosyltransferase involved in cell wall biosynthesis
LPILSIITICKNESESIERTILSVIGQTFTDFEYIVIDGGSTDGTKEIIEKYKDKIDKFISEPDKGIFNAMNKGISLSNSEYVCFLNGGDYFAENNILERIFENKTDSDIIFGDLIFSLKSGRKYTKKSPDKISQYYMMSDSIPHPGTLIKRELFDEIGFYDENYKFTSDYEFFLRAIFKFNMSYSHLKFPLAVFNLKGVSSILEKTKEVKAEREKAQNMYLSNKCIMIFKLFKPFFLVVRKLKYLSFYFQNSEFRIQNSEFGSQ